MRESHAEDSTLMRLRTAAAELFPLFDILVGYAYGSRVSGRPRPSSDLDVGYYLRGYLRGARLALRDELALADRLSDRVGVEVELRDLGPAPLEVRGRILEEGVRIYSSHEVERVALERDLLTRFHDYKAEFEAMHRLRLRSLAERGKL